jgi:hypothetical protein
VTPGGGARSGLLIAPPETAVPTRAALARVRRLHGERESLRIEAIEVALRLRFHRRRRDGLTALAATGFLGPVERGHVSQSAQRIAVLETRRVAIQQRLLTIARSLRAEGVQARLERAAQ